MTTPTTETPDVLEAYRKDAVAIRAQTAMRSWSSVTILRLWDALAASELRLAKYECSDWPHVVAERDALRARLAEAEGRLEIERAANRIIAMSLGAADEELRLLRVNARPALAHDKEKRGHICGTPDAMCDYSCSAPAEEGT